jgi:hypothetical protein
MAETFVIDPSEVAASRTQLDITPFVRADGVDWGDSQFEAYMAEAQVGSVPVDGRLPNRIVTAPLTLRAVGATTFATIRRQIQAKVGLLQRQGGWVKRDLSGTPVFLDVVNASLRLGGAWTQAKTTSPFDVEGTLTLECIPDFYGAEVDLGLLSESTNPELIGTYTTVTGDYPARTRIVVTDAQGQSQLGLLWGFRQRYYDSATTAKLAYGAPALTPLDLATVSGGDVIYTNIATVWTPVLNTNTSGSYLTHRGTYRVWGSVASPSATAVDVRFVWDVGDMTLPVENDAVAVPGIGTNATGGMYIVDLGEVRIDAAPVGTHRWQGQIQARGAVGNEEIWVRRLWFQPVDDGAGRVRAPLTVSPGLAGFTARDEFNQSAGSLTGKTLAAGGTWAGAGDTDDFAVETTGHTAQRTAVSDTAPRFGIAGTNTLTNVVVGASLKASVASTNMMGVFARYTDASNCVRAYVMTPPGLTPSSLVTIDKVVGGVETTLSVAEVSFFAGTFYRLELYADAAGRWSVFYGALDAAEQIMSGADSALATGGSRASGKVGLFDYQQLAAAVTRNYDNFYAYAPVANAVVFASRSAELRWDGMYRQDSTGTSSGPIAHVIGGLPRIPPAGLEARTTEVFVKLSRGDLEQLPDGGNADDLNVRVYARPSWLFTPA